MGGHDDCRGHPDRPGNRARTRHEPPADPRDPPGRVSPRSTYLIASAWPRSPFSRHSSSSAETPLLHWSLATPCSPLASLHSQLATTHWPLPVPHSPLAPSDYPLCSRSTPHAAPNRPPHQRGRVMRRPSPAGYCHPTIPELPKTDRGPISPTKPSLIFHRPGDSDGQIAPFPETHSPPPVIPCRWTQRSTPGAIGLPAGWPSSAMPVLSLPLRKTTISRVEVWRGGLGSAYRFPALSFAGASLAPPCSVSTPRSSNRAGGFPAPGFRTRLYLICCFTRSPTNDCRYVRWSWYNPSSWYRYWSWNRFFPFPGTLNFAHNH